MQTKHIVFAIGPLLVAAIVASALGQDEPRPPTAESPNKPRDYAAPGQRRYNFDPTPLARPVADSLQSGYYTSQYTPYPTVLSETFRVPLTAEEATLSQQATALINQINASDSNSEKGELKTKLSEALGKQFDLRQKRHQKEIEELEAQVKKLKDLVQRRQDNREEIISRKLDQIIRDSQGLGF